MFSPSIAIVTFLVRIRSARGPFPGPSLSAESIWAAGRLEERSDGGGPANGRGFRQGCRRRNGQTGRGVHHSGGQIRSHRSEERLDLGVQRNAQPVRLFQSDGQMERRVDGAHSRGRLRAPAGSARFPLPGKDRIETVIRLKKGRTVRGRVLHHLGKPVKNASLFAGRPNGMTLAGGGLSIPSTARKTNGPRGEDRFGGTFRAGPQRCPGTGASVRRSAGISSRYAGIGRLEPDA